MAKARRRDEWDRWAQLLSLVDCRSGFGDDFKPKSPFEYFPPELDTDAERWAVWSLKKRNTRKVSARELCEMHGVK